MEKYSHGKPTKDRDGVTRDVMMMMGRPKFHLEKEPLIEKNQLQFLRDSRIKMYEGKPFDLSKLLPSPMMSPNVDRYDVVIEGEFHFVNGNNANYWMEVQDKYANGSRIANFVIPKIIKESRTKRLTITDMVVLNDPNDCERIAKNHLEKQPNFTNNLGHSIISTDDNESWRQQRQHFNEAFLPMASLAKLFPVSLARASKCGERMAELMGKSNVVDMSAFFLHETQAQLQLAMFGETEEFMNKTNEPFRNSLNAQPATPTVVREVIMGLTDRMKDNVNNNVSPIEAAAQGCPVRGPLGRLIGNFKGKRSEEYSTLYGNGLIFAFAGHDTTGHTLTWLLYEVSQNKSVKSKLCKEIDDFLASAGDREIEYEDLKKLPYLTRCIMETLRLWPAVANGTTRMIEFDDYCTGPNGTKVPLPRGTYVQIANWCRHRSKELWGDDVNEFVPERNFTHHELWGNDGLRGYNMSTGRFSPFTYAPRGCIGMNFAQMEMRTILIKLLSQFDFELIPTSIPKEHLFVNKGTMGPRKTPFPARLENGMIDIPRVGLDFKVTPRQQHAKL